MFYDNLQVIHTRGPLLQESHYSPWGLELAGISAKAAGKLENNYKFNKGSELQHHEFSDGSGLEWYDTHFRNLDPQLGRWQQIDPKIDEDQESLSPYISMGNNPVLKNDPLGDVADCQWCKEVWKDIKDAAKETVTSAYNGAVSVARTVNSFNPIASVVEVISGKSSQSDFAEDKPRAQAVADLGVNTVMMLTGEVGAGAKAGAPLAQSAKVETEVVQRAMSKAELNATKETGLIRGGREGTHYVSNAIGNDAKRVQQRLALGDKPEVKVTMQVPKGSFSSPTKVESVKLPNGGTLPGGGMERTASGNIPVQINKVKELKNGN